MESPSPQLREQRGEPLRPCEWGSALSVFREGFRRIQKAHGRTAASWTVSPNLTNEELAFCALLARQGMGFTAGEPGAAPMISAAWEAPEESDVVIAFGEVVTALDSPLWQRLSCSRHQPRVTTIGSTGSRPVHDEHPRYTPLPGSTLTLLHGLANIIVASGWADLSFVQQRTSGFGEYATLLSQYTTDRVCAETGFAAEALWELAQIVGTGARVSYCGQPEGGSKSADAVRNLALLTGQWGRPGTGLCFELEPANAFGAHLLGETGSLARCEAALKAGTLKALWIVASNAAYSTEELQRWTALAEQLDFCVVQGGSPLGVAQQADLFLPTSDWQTKEGTRLDPAGRLRLLKVRARSASAAMTDFRLFQLIAQYWGCGASFQRWSSPECAFQILKETTRGTAHDFSGISDYAAIDAYRPRVVSTGSDAPRLPFLIAQERSPAPSGGGSQ